MKGFLNQIYSSSALIFKQIRKNSLSSGSLPVNSDNKKANVGAQGALIGAGMGLGLYCGFEQGDSLNAISAPLLGGLAGGAVALTMRRPFSALIFAGIVGTSSVITCIGSTEDTKLKGNYNNLRYASFERQKSKPLTHMGNSK